MLDTLEKEDPVKFKEVVDQLEKQRMKERMSLKHKNTSKWAKQKTIYGKFNETARQQVQDQLEIAKNLTKKLKQFEVNSREEEDEPEANKNEETPAINIQSGLLENNPWMKMMSGVGGQSTDTNNDAAPDNDYSQPKAFKNGIEIKKAEEDFEDSEDDSDDEHIIDKSTIEDVIGVFKDDEECHSENENENEAEKPKEVVVEEEKIEKKIKKSKITETIKNDVGKDIEQKNVETKPSETNIKPITQDIEFNKVETDLEIDVDNKKSNNRQLSNHHNKQHQITLSEAFADDDVIEEFKSEKVWLSP